ncbi:MAG: hypothetical protein DRG83_06610 [Deltaproteobacteria bacterium]|nr:MAG: hypothetical protein DRG83_06610 [Deltaproteobacteria bacterium]
MKKSLITLALILGIGFLASQVVAWGPGHGAGYWGHGSGAYHSGYYNGNDTLRQKLNEKIAEYDAVINQGNPDPERARELSREITELRKQLRTRAGSYGNTYHTGPHGAYCGWNHGGGAHGYCW